MFSQKQSRMKAMYYLKKIFADIERINPITVNSIGSVYRDHVVIYYGSKEYAKTVPLKSLTLKEDCSTRYVHCYKYHANAKEYWEIYHQELTELLHKEIYHYVQTFNKRKDQLPYQMLLFQFEGPFRNLSEVVRETIKTYGYLTPNVAENTYQILSAFDSVMKKRKEELMNSNQVELLSMDIILAERLSFEMEYIEKCIKPRNIPELVSKVESIIADQNKPVINQEVRKVAPSSSKGSKSNLLFEVLSVLSNVLLKETKGR